MEREYIERVELACHTGYSKYMGIGCPGDFAEYAISNRMMSLAVTDIGCMGGFPELYNYAEDYPEFKPIYGCEFYIQVDKKMPVRITLLLKNESGMVTVRNMFRQIETSYRRCKDGPVIIPIDAWEQLINWENHHSEVFIGIYADDFERYEKADYVMITPDTEEKSVHETLSKCRERKIIPVAVSTPFYTSADLKLAYDALWEGNSTFLSKRNDAHFMTTDEMMECFSFLGDEEVYNLVIGNTNIIARQCSLEMPYTKELFIPKPADAAERITSICKSALKRKYKDVTPEIERRLKWELDAVISNGNEYLFLTLWDVMQNIDIRPFEIGNRGTVGCSLIAYLMDITSVDPIKYNLPPYFLFSYDGNRTPDIDLNLRSENMWKLFTKEYATLPCVAELIMPGFYRFYNEAEAEELIEWYVDKSELKVNKDDRINAAGSLTKTVIANGRHPGGIIFVPNGCHKDNKAMIPVRNIGDNNHPVLVSEYDYHSIDHIYTKVDLLFHKIPEVLYRLWQITGVDPASISHEDPEIMKLFIPDSDGKFNCAGLPEFDSEETLEMLCVAKPENISELATVLGYAHGTGVWESARKLIEENTATISEIPGCREEIFNYLVLHGIDEKEAFDISELVRKGRISRSFNSHTPWAERTRKKWTLFREKSLNLNIPEWYLNHLENIKYMFPKAHSLAYMIQAWQIAWYKLHYPMEYYKVMLDVMYDFVDFSSIENGLDELRAKYENVEPSDENLYFNPNRKSLYIFMKQLYADGYSCAVKCGGINNLCQIDRKNSRFVLLKREK